MDKVNIKNLYVGFVNSYNSLLLASENGITSVALDTHAIIDWFRRAGVTFGYYPYCEHKRRDLEWYTEDGKVLLHLESENFYSKVDHTINKLVDSNAPYRIGLVWSDKTPEHIENHIKRLTQESATDKWEALLIVRFANDGKKDKEGCWHCLVRAWWIHGGNKTELPRSYISAPSPWGFQTAAWGS